jgi:RNA binding exosome subunit
MEVFPTPRPLTAEEQALVTFAAQASPAAKREVIEAERHLGDPIVIAELKIHPLDEKDRK